jgi:hypothetical protein
MIKKNVSYLYEKKMKKEKMPRTTLYDLSLTHG